MSTQKEMYRLEISKDLKSTAINQRLNELVKEVKKITATKSVVILVNEVKS